MCIFHKEVATTAAIDHVSGEFDPARYIVALVSIKPRIELFMPDMFGCDGFIASELVTDTALRSLEDCKDLTDFLYHNNGQLKSLEEIEAAHHTFFEEHAPFLRHAMRKTSETHELSAEGLKIPASEFKGITVNGYKKTCCAEADPTDNPPFIEQAAVKLYTGYRPQQNPGEHYAAGPLELLEQAPEPELVLGYDLEAVRQAAAHFMTQDGVSETIETMFLHSLAYTFRRAPRDIELGQTRTKSAGCAMCLDAEFRGATGGAADDRNDPQPVAEA